MATQLFQIMNSPPPPRESDWRGPGGVHFDDLTLTVKCAIAADNDVIQIDFRMPPDESWLVHQMRAYNSDGDPFDSVSVQYRRPGRELDFSGTGQWDFTTGPPTTYNLFFDSGGSGGGGSVTYTIESNSWKQPPYIGPRTIVRMGLYVNKVGGWAANNEVSWQFLVDRIPVIDLAKMTQQEVLERLSGTPMGGWFDR